MEQGGDGIMIPQPNQTISECAINKCLGDLDKPGKILQVLRILHPDTPTLLPRTSRTLPDPLLKRTTPCKKCAVGPSSADYFDISNAAAN